MPGNLARSLPKFLSEDCALMAIEGWVHTETLTGALTLDPTYPNIVKLDPGGAGRNVTLDAEESSKGLTRLVVNGADGDESLTVLDDAVSPLTIGTVAQNRAGLFYCDGLAWSLGWICTIAMS